MRLAIVLALLFATSTNVLSGPAQPARHVDLREDVAVAELQRSNPRHYAQIQEIVAELLAEPRKAENGWLQTRFNARDVELEKLRFMTSYPPKQLLEFTLEDTRYTMHLVREDLDAKLVPAH